ncbi:MAG: hypothetical protein QM627_04275 [Luteolibacter sp.]
MALPGTSSPASGRIPAIRPACPACGTSIETTSTHCPRCHFTGADTMKLFPGGAPPLLPVLDVASVWNAAGLRAIEAARSKVEKRFPQFRWHFVAVEMPAATSLNLLGFWLLNASPLTPPETANQRAWSVVVVINRTNGQATVAPGYAAEPWVTPSAWQDALAAMKPFWRIGESGKAAAAFLDAAARILEREWKNTGSPRTP